MKARDLLRTDRLTIARCLALLVWLDVHPQEHRLVERDILYSSASIALFFPGQNSATEILERWRTTQPPTAAEILDNNLKARAIPRSRSSQSNQTMPSTFYENAREILSTNGGYPDEWSLQLRPMIAKLYKEGIITPAYNSQSAGQVIWAAEPGKDASMYIDYKWVEKSYFKPLSGVTDYRQVDLLDSAKRWSQKTPHARFALFKIWTHSHFFPLTMGVDKRPIMSFADSLGRTWEFKFFPIDIWWSEWNMQNMVDERLGKWKRTLGSRYEMKRDIVLVKGENEVDLQRYATAVAFGLQTRPWRFEIDLWKSFINVDMAFLEGLDSAWWE